MLKNQNRLFKAILKIIRFVIALGLFIIFAACLLASFEVKGANLGTFIILIILTIGVGLSAYYVLPPETRIFGKIYTWTLTHMPFNFKTKQYMRFKDKLQDLALQEDKLIKQIALDKQEHLNWTNKVNDLQKSYNELKSKHDDLKANLENDDRQVQFGGKYMTIQEALQNHDQIIKDFNDVKRQKQQIASFYSGKLFQEFLDYRVTLEFDKIDGMNGLEFEDYISGLLTKIGFRDSYTTSASGDNGIDVLAKNGSTFYGIQCKLYSNPVGNRAVQEAFAGGSFYHTDKNIVVTNDYFTPSAKQAANAMDVDLWDHDKLSELIKDTFTIFDTQRIPETGDSSLEGRS